MKKVSLHGSYFGDNFGDTLFVIEYVNWLKELDSYDKNKVMLPFAGDRVRELVDVSEKRGIRSILNSDVVVFIGGGYLGEPPTRKKVWSYRLIIRHLLVVLLSYLFRKPYVFIGVGAGPLSHKLARKLTVFLLNKSKKVIVRDEESYQYLIEYGVNKNKLLTTADSILSLQPSDVNKELKKKIINKYQLKDNELLIGLHLPISLVYKESLMDLIKDLKNYTKQTENYKLVVFKDFYKEDYNYFAYSYTKELFEDENIEYVEYESPEQLISLIDTLDIVITTKLHCGIVANCLGKYTLAISAHTKTKRLYKQLELSERQVSLPDYKKGDLVDMLAKYDENIKYYDNIPENIRDASKMNKLELLKFVSK